MAASSAASVGVGSIELGAGYDTAVGGTAWMGVGTDCLACVDVGMFDL